MPVRALHRIASHAGVARRCRYTLTDQRSVLPSVEEGLLIRLHKRMRASSYTIAGQDGAKLFHWVNKGHDGLVRRDEWRRFLRKCEPRRPTASARAAGRLLGGGRRREVPHAVGLPPSSL